MKKWIFLLAFALLLTGCQKQPSMDAPESTGTPETEVLAEQSIAFAVENVNDSDFTWYAANVAVELGIVAGATYKVVWDGTEHICQCYTEVSGGGMKLSGLFLGNAYLFLEIYADTAEPFFIYAPDGNTKIIAADESESHTVSITLIEAVALEQIEATADDEGKFLRVVDGKAAWVTLTDVSQEGA